MTQISSLSAISTFLMRIVSQPLGFKVYQIPEIQNQPGYRLYTCMPSTVIPMHQQKLNYDIIEQLSHWYNFLGLASTTVAKISLPIWWWDSHFATIVVLIQWLNKLNRLESHNMEAHMEQTTLWLYMIDSPNMKNCYI